MEEIYLELFSTGEVYLAPIDTLVVLSTMKYCESDLKITLIVREKPPDVHAYQVDIVDFSFKIVNGEDRTNSCELPNLRLNACSVVAGLCACLRQIIKLKIATAPEHYCRSLLGFKDSCLLAPSECSPWTKFCEVELISVLKNFDIHSATLPEVVARFEVHMSQPVRLHNIYKYTMSKKFSRDGTVTQDRSILPEHVYAEGSFMTLADVIIFLCIHIFLKFVASHRVLNITPLIAKWYKTMMADDNISKCLGFIEVESSLPTITEYFLPTVANQSLYKSDVKRYRPRNRIYTRQEDVERSLEIIKNTGVNLEISREPFGHEIDVNWSEIPFEANPDGGCLPTQRSKRKFEQLENLCRPVLKLAKPGDVIVDFCAGSGHLGILIAYLRPNCTVILLENKEESLNRAKLRVKKLKLSNIAFYQCNLDYFNGDFDIGTSLHACGVATDLVIQHCIRKNAIFVSCPCCYGSVQNCHHISYPRSSFFRRNMDLRDYLVVGHAADQTHDEKNAKTKQGYQCMSIIDTDRKLQAEEFGYTVYLGKLVPETCTPKNHLIVGIPGEKLIHDLMIKLLK